MCKILHISILSQNRRFFRFNGFSDFLVSLYLFMFYFEIQFVGKVDHTRSMSVFITAIRQKKRVLEAGKPPANYGV